MPLDPRIVLAAAPPAAPPVDVFGSLQRGLGTAYQMRGAEQQLQVQQLKLEEAQRAEFERQNLGQAIRGTMTTDPATGQPTPNIPGALGRAYATSRDPLGLLKIETEYGKSQAESRKSTLEAEKIKLEGLQKQTEFVSGIAQGALQAVQQGADPQVVWQRAVQQVAAAGLPTANLPPTYDAGLLQQYAMSTLKAGDALQAQQKVIDQQLRELELKETQKRTAIEQEGLGIRREDVAARREEVAERRAERQQTRETQTQQRLGERENQLRDEFNTLTKDYRLQSDAYGRIQVSAEDPSAAGDLSLIFSYMKMLDPGSTVREGEQATAANARGVDEAVRSWYNRVLTGERLAPEQRADFVTRAQKLYGQATRDYDKTRTQYQDLARRYGADPANVTLEYGSTATPLTSGAGGPGGAAAPPGKVLSEQDITDTIAASQTAGRPVTRQQVIDAARAKGYQVP